MHKKKRILIVDGYNVLGAWRSGMGSMESARMDAARDELTDMLRDYAGYAGQAVILVYDAWLSDRKTRTEETSAFSPCSPAKRPRISTLSGSPTVWPMTSPGQMRSAGGYLDSVEQTDPGRGPRLSARELLAEIEHTRSTGRRRCGSRRKRG